MTNIQATEVSVPQVNSSESSGGKEIARYRNTYIGFGFSLHFEKWLCLLNSLNLVFYYYFFCFPVDLK